MTNTEADQQLDKLRKIADARDNETATITAALKAGARVTDVAAAVRRTREHVRRIARAHGL